jgi:hypothetical protein
MVHPPPISHIAVALLLQVYYTWFARALAEAFNY